MHNTQTRCELNGCALQNIFELVGYNNWDEMMNMSYVCKSWRSVVAPQLDKVGLEPMVGGAERKLNVNKFLVYFTRPIFQNVESIYVPCGKRKSDRLFVNDIKQICPNVTSIYHSKWLMVSGIEEFVIKGSVRHSVYKHDHPFIEGVNV